jgi:NAD(P)H-quinone oxidoreductase subunit 4
MISAEFPWLSLITLLPVVAAFAIPFIPDNKTNIVRWYALSVGIVDLALMLYCFSSSYDLQESTFQLFDSYAWIPQLGIRWSVAVDGL